MPARPTAAWNNWAAAGRIFMIFYVGLGEGLLKPIEKIPVWLESDKNNRHFT